LECGDQAPLWSRSSIFDNKAAPGRRTPKKKLMNPTDEETLEDDVNYGIADCRKRLRARARSQRSTLRVHHPPKTGSSADVGPATARVGSYAEALAVSLSQRSLSRLVECLLEPPREEELIEREEAVIT